MPWSALSPMDQRVHLIADYQRGLATADALAERYGVSRKTVYKWVDRYRAQGATGLQDRSRRPHTCPHATDRLVMEMLLEFRQRHPTWGPKKLLAVARARYPDWPLPAPSTLGGRLLREGLVAPDRRHRRHTAAHPGAGQTAMSAPNAVWTMDFKGQFRVSGTYCFPLTIMDGCSRYLLGCDPLRHATHENAARIIARLFRTYGLPDVIRSDNGAPFASPAIGRLSRLAIWWIHLGIRPELIEPGHPQQNGRHERFHRTLKLETAMPPAATWSEQQLRFRRFRREYNHERPHEALGQRVPAAIYAPSARRLPRRLPAVAYPDHFEVRRVGHNGCLSWRQHYVTVGQVLRGEDVGLEAIDDGIWTIYFGPVRLGRFDERLKRLDETS